MNVILDNIFNTFLYFRLGSKDSNSSRESLYVDINDDNDNGKVMSHNNLPELKDKCFRVCVISDTHERHASCSIPNCDILFHAGDILMTSRFISDDECRRKYHKFNDWLGTLTGVKHKVIIGGNHDRLLQQLTKEELDKIFTNCTYLDNKMIEIEEMNFYGSSLSSGTSNNKAFQDKEYYNQTVENINSIQSKSDKLDVLILHGPNDELVDLMKPRVFIYGHLHCYYGIKRYKFGTISINASIMNGNYNPFNLPIVFDISKV